MRKLSTATFFSLVLITTFGMFKARAESEASSASGFSSPERKVLIKPFIEVPGLFLELKSITQQDKVVVWSPNYRTQTGVSLGYDGLIGVAIAGKGDLKQEDLDLKGSTTYSDFRFRFPWRRVSVEFGYQKTKGFFAENTSAFAPGSAPIKRPDLQLESKYLQLIGVLKPNRYSLAAAFDHSELQRTSGGSPLAVLQFIETSFSDSQELIPSQLQSAFGAEALIKRGIFQTVNAGLGYGYLFRFGDTGYVFAQGLLGVGAQLGKTYSDTQEFSANESSFLARTDIGVGASGDRMVGGLHLSLDSTSNKTAATELSRRLTLVQVFIGIRL